MQTLADYNTRYFEALRSEENKEIELDHVIEDSEEPFVYSYHCHEGALALAYALNLTIAGTYNISDCFETYSTNEDVLLDIIIIYYC